MMSGVREPFRVEVASGALLESQKMEEKVEVAEKEEEAENG